MHLIHPLSCTEIIESIRPNIAFEAVDESIYEDVWFLLAVSLCSILVMFSVYISTRIEMTKK
jgi:hypothetical protein